MSCAPRSSGSATSRRRRRSPSRSRSRPRTTCAAPEPCLGPSLRRREARLRRWAPVSSPSARRTGADRGSSLRSPIRLGGRLFTGRSGSAEKAFESGGVALGSFALERSDVVRAGVAPLARERKSEPSSHVDPHRSVVSPDVNDGIAFGSSPLLERPSSLQVRRGCARTSLEASCARHEFGPNRLRAELALLAPQTCRWRSLSTSVVGASRSRGRCSQPMSATSRSRTDRCTTSRSTLAMADAGT